MALAIWGKRWSGHTVLIRTDNMAVVHILNSGSARNEDMMHLLRSSFFILAQWSISITSQHLPGCHNQVAECLVLQRAIIIPLTLPSLVSPSNSYSSLPTEPPHHPPSRLDRPTPANSVHFYFEKGLAPATLQVYSSSQRQFLSFCSRTNQSPLPTSQDTLCSFVADLADKGLKYRSIKSYLAGIQNLHITQGLPSPSTNALPRLQLVMRGIQRHQAETGSRSAYGFPLPQRF